MTPSDFLSETVWAETYRRVAFIESDCAEAMTLQEYGYLERLVVVHAPDAPPAVASLLADVIPLAEGPQ